MFKPMIKGSARGLGIAFFLAGIAMIVAGVYFGFIQGRGYEKTTAVITQVDTEPDETSDDPDGTREIATVTYTVDGKTYEAVLNDWNPGWKLGKEISVRYDPADPQKVLSDAPGFVVYLIGVGAAIIAVELFAFLKNRKQRRVLSEVSEASLFHASRRGETERRLYFLTDQGTVKGGCHIEDADRSVLYEAVCTKFSLVADSEYDFIDHTLSRRTPHLVGKTVTTTSDAIWALDSHSTFTLDGVDVWKQLHSNGIRIQTGLNGLKWAYAIYRDDVHIADVVAANKNVHEEDEAAKGVLAKVPFPGFYRIRTYEEDLDAVFLTIFAIGRTDMMVYS